MSLKALPKDLPSVMEPPLGLFNTTLGQSSNSIHSTDIAFYTFKALKIISYRAKVWVWAGCEKEKHIQWKLQGEFREMKFNYPVWNLARATLLQTPWDLSDHTWTSASCLLQKMRTAPAKCAQSSGTGEGLLYKVPLLPRHLIATGAHINSDLRNFQIFSIKQFQLLIIFTNDPPHKSINWS